MIEAVSIAVQSSSFVRPNADRNSVAESFAANPQRVQQVAQAPYISPYVYLDVNYDKAVLQLRNGETGAVEGQIPSEPALQARARETARQAQQGADPQPQPETQRTESSAPAPQQAQPAEVKANAATAQQLAAFSAAARAGNSNAGSVTLFA